MRALKINEKEMLLFRSEGKPARLYSSSGNVIGLYMNLYQENNHASICDAAARVRAMSEDTVEIEI